MKKLFSSYTIVLFVSFFIVLTFFIGGGGKNLLQIGTMAASFILLPIYFIQSRKMDRRVFVFLILLVLMLLFAFNNNSFRFETYIYSCAFVCSFVLFYLFGKHHLEYTPRYVSIIKGIIIAYFVCLLIQQCCVFLDLPVPNQYLVYPNKFKLPSLTNEPSHLAMFSFFLMYGYLRINENQDRDFDVISFAKSQKFMFFAYVYVMLTCFSATAYFLFFLPFLKKIKIKYIAYFIGVGCLFVLFDQELMNRVIRIAEAFFSFSSETIDRVDHSAAYRFVPLFTYLQSVDVFSSSFWLGYGTDASKVYFSREMFYISKDVAYDTTYNIGGLFGFFYDYGFICGCIFLLSIYLFVKKNRDYVFSIAWLLIILFLPFNSALLWCSLLISCLVQNSRKLYESAS